MGNICENIFKLGQFMRICRLKIIFSNFSSVGGHFVAGRGTIWTILVDGVSKFILKGTKTIIKNVVVFTVFS